MAGKTVLVVEDNHDELTIYTTLLRHHGYEVLTATDFQSAVDAARHHRPDLAIIDVNLGDGHRDGCDVVAALRSDPATAGLPVIAHTAFGDVYRRQLESSGCETIVHKPSNPLKLLDEVKRLIEQPPPRSA